MNLEDFLQDMEKEGGDAALMADKIRLLDSVMGNALRQHSIMRSDGMAPFAAVSSPEDRSTIQNIYLPIDTVVRQIIGPALEAAITFMTDLKERTDKGGDDEADKIIKSVITKRNMDILSYCEGIIDALVGASMAIMDTMGEAQFIIKTVVDKQNGVEMESTGDPELDKMLRASQLINATKKPILQ